jgi:hypothetical protein
VPVIALLYKDFHTPDTSVGCHKMEVVEGHRLDQKPFETQVAIIERLLIWIFLGDLHLFSIKNSKLNE